MQVPLYEDLQAYIRNSAVYTAHTMTDAAADEFGDNDGTVHWHQGVELYNIARRAGKNVVMLPYGGEDHGLRKRQNQIDYHHRIFEWFDHYLTGAPKRRVGSRTASVIWNASAICSSASCRRKPITTTSPQ